MIGTLKEFLKRPPFRYLSAVVAVGLAFLLREALSLVAGPNFPEYLLFYPTIMIVALLAGPWPALLATGTAAAIVALLILPWHGPSVSSSASNFVSLGLFVVVCAFLSVVADLYRRSRQKAAAYDKEQALRESQEALRRQAELLKLSFDAVIVRRLDGAVESWNRGAEELYGFSEGEAMGRDIHDLLSTTTVTPWPDFNEQLRRRGQWEGELRHRTKDGREVVVSSRQHIGGGFDGRERVLEIDRDITDRIRVQEELQRAHDKLEEMVGRRTSDLQRANRMLRMVSACDQALVQISDEVELMHVICQIIQDEGNYPLVWVGLKEGDDAGSIRPAASAADPDKFLDGVRASWGEAALGSGPPEDAIRAGSPVICGNIADLPESIPWKEAALHNRFLSMAALPLKGASETAFGALVIYSERPSGSEEGQINLLKELVDDLSFGITSLRARTERDQAQKALEVKASQLQLLAGELVRTEERERRRIALLLHDQLQQLLAAALYGLSSLSAARKKNAEFLETSTKLRGVLRECIRMSRTLTSELSHPALSEPDLSAALEWLASWVKEKHGLKVEVETAEAVIVEAEETRIMLLQAVRELLFNVVKHAGVKTARVRLNLAEDGRVLITVSDKGVGFDAAKMRTLGDPSGGIGLFSIRERLALTGGGMEFESVPGRGSRFTVWAPAQLWSSPSERLPSGTRRSPGKRVAARKSPAHSPSPQSDDGGGRIRVLVVDDHGVVRDGLASRLSSQPDIEIVGEASDGETAVKLVRRLSPDVVTMDVGMPGMNGIEATRAIHAEHPAVTIIGLSMFAEDEKANEMRAAGASAYFSKSEPFDSLLAAIRASSGKGRAERSRRVKRD